MESESDSLSGECDEIFDQEGVYIKTCCASYMNFLSANGGNLCITQYSDEKKCVEWKPLVDITVDNQDKEWAVINTVERRRRTLSGSIPPESQNRSKYLRIPFGDIKSFKVSHKSRIVTFLDGKSELIVSFSFQNANSDHFIGVLKMFLKTAPSKRDKHTFIVLDDNNYLNLETQQIERSFAELNLFQDHSTLWRYVKNFHDRPMETTFEAFAKVTDYVYRSPESRDIDEETREFLNKSLTDYGTGATSHSQGDYEVVAKAPQLPPRREFPREAPLSIEQWVEAQNSQEVIDEDVKKIIFRGGVSKFRPLVWKYLLDYYPWDLPANERQKLIADKEKEYFAMKLQWKTISKTQEDNFSDYKERKGLIEKDVNRTDRTLPFYAGDNNPNLQVLFEILMTYVMYNFDLGYVQGMSDLLSPILHLMKNEVDAFWCFVGFMNKVSSNFDIDQAGMKEQLSNLNSLIAFVEPDLANYLNQHDSGNMFFCFRWLLVWFKRELNEDDVMYFWEVLWTGYPCENFHLLVCVAILSTEKHALMENDYGFTEILKHVNELSGKLDIQKMLSIAEGIFYQIKEAPHLTDPIRLILGLPLLGNTSIENESSLDDSTDTTTQPFCSVENVRISPDEISYDQAVSSNFL